MKKVILIILLAFIFFFPRALNAKTYDPRQIPNNVFGIHILSENDIPDAQKLVNTNGGDWGYVTLVIRQDERNIKKWQETFDKLREAHLIPIVRIASEQRSGYWEELKEDDIKNWVYFLNSLNWVVKNRYVVVGNEPNHKKEWGNEINPEEYAKYLKTFSKKARSANENFFILPAGLDASAPDGDETMSEERFLQKMKKAESDIFSEIDGWTSHSYPNPSFSGSWRDTGKGSIKTYKWEIEYLKSMGVEKDLPIFITETGWAHNADGKVLGLKDEKQVSEEISSAYKNAWQEKGIVAITPFVLNYANDPFSHFSWKREDGTFYDFYQKVAELSKTAGSPIREEKGVINHVLTVPSQSDENTFWGIAYIKNDGQTIWEKESVTLDHSLGYAGEYDSKTIIDSHPLKEKLKPGEKSVIFFKIQTKGIFDTTAIRLKRGAKVISTKYRFEISKKKETAIRQKNKTDEGNIYDLFWETAGFLAKIFKSITTPDEVLASI